MKDDNLKALLKEAYSFTPAPAGLFTRIRDEAESEQVILNNKRVDFSKPNPLVSKTDPDEEKETVVSLGLFKKTHTKKSAIITISAAAACIVLCIVTLAVTGVFSGKKNDTLQPMSEAEAELPGGDTEGDTEITGLPAGQSPRVSASLGQKAAAVSANVVSLSDVPEDVTVIPDFPQTIVTPVGSEVVEFGRVATLSFEDEAPKGIEVYVDLYSGDGQKVEHESTLCFSWPENPVTEASFAASVPASVSEDGKVLSFPILDYFDSVSITEEKKEKTVDFYYSFLVKCAFEDREVEYSLIVHTDNTSDEIMAKVVTTSPVIVVRPITERELFAGLNEVTLSGVTYARYLNSDLESEDIESYELKPDDVILFKYNGKEPGNAFPQVIENAKIFINPLAEEFPLASTSLKDVVTSFGTVKDVVYFNLSTGVDEYSTEDPARIELLLNKLSEVKVRGTYDYEIADGTWDEKGCEGDEMWQISFGFEGKEDGLVLRLNPLELVTKLESELFPEGQNSVKLVFDEETSLSSETVKELATQQDLLSASEISPEQVLALALNATYEVVSTDFVSKRMEFDRGYSVDLNGDGTQDHLYASCARKTDANGFTDIDIVLVINGKLFEMNSVSPAYIASPDDSCYDLIDVSSDDAYIEIVLSDFGPSDDFCCHFYDYEEGSLNYLGTVDGDLPASHLNNGGIKVKGDGIIGSKKRLSLVQNWDAETDYKLTDRRKIKEVERDYYYPVNGMNLTAKCDLVVYSRMDTSSELVTIPAGPVTLPMTDDKNFVMIRGADGSEGYMHIEYGRITTMDDEPSVTDVFEGLFLAD